MPSRANISQLFQDDVEFCFDGRQDVGQRLALQLGQAPRHFDFDLARDDLQFIADLSTLGREREGQPAAIAVA